MNRLFLIGVIATLFIALPATPALSGEYPALDGIDGVKAVFDVTAASPRAAYGTFRAARHVYQDENVRALATPPKVAVVFHGAAVKLISTDWSEFPESEHKNLKQFTDLLRQMKKEGVTLEVCLYAAKGQGVDPAEIMEEVDHVANGFISVIGYQHQGYAVVTID
jgi:intracellular sulfur oxidation DsrE/DsrF family protein